jgi:hypothetical protein
MALKSVHSLSAKPSVGGQTSLSFQTTQAGFPATKSGFPVAKSVLPSAKPGDLISTITVQNGPADVLGRFFLAADAGARARGVTLSFGSYDDLVATNELNRETWRPLHSMFDPRVHDFDASNSFCILGRNAAGDVVATQAARRIDLTGTTLYDEAVNLRLNYDHPERDKLPGETCTVTAEMMKNITGVVLLGGAVWYRKDYRGRELATILPRISRAYGYTLWEQDYTTSIMVAGVAKGGVAAASGYTNVQPELHFANCTLGEFSAYFVWMEPPQLISDLRQFLTDVDTQVDTGIAQRRA